MKPVAKQHRRDATAPEVEERDALVIGGNMAGISIAYLLGHLGYRTTLIEAAPFLGGIDGSFKNALGRTFDFGVHALDHGRSPYVTRLMERAVDGRFRRVPKTRALLLRGHLFPYNAPPEDWPHELRALLKSGAIYDDLGAALPTRQRLGEIYGRAFADFIFDEVLASYPAERRQLAFGVDEAALLRNIYPWFFPRVERVARDDNPHYRYQARVRAEGGEHVIYPDSGGFAGFAEGLAERARAAGVEFEVGARDLDVRMDSARRAVERVTANGRAFASPRVYWCGPANVLLDLLGEPSFHAAPETFALGSLQFERPLKCPYLEFIGGDPRHLIKRASCPGKLQGTADDVIQLEYHFPRDDEGAEGHGQEKPWWCETWLASLRELGIVQPDNEPLDIDVKLIPMHYNGFGCDGQPTPDVVLPEFPLNTNLKPVLPSYRKININTRLPQYLEFLAHDLAHDVAR